MISKIVFFRNGVEVKKGLIDIRFGLEKGVEVAATRLELESDQWDSFQAFGKTVQKSDLNAK